jgi:hypothetical protein
VIFVSRLRTTLYQWKKDVAKKLVISKEELLKYITHDSLIRDLSGVRQVTNQIIK